MVDRKNATKRARLRGLSSLELVFAILILAIALMPIYDIFITSYKTVFRSKYSYVAQHVAREMMEELRQIPFDYLEAKQWHDWQVVEGHLFGLTLQKITLATNNDLNDATLNYSDNYKRIETRLAIEEVTDVNTGNIDPRLRKVIVEIRWQEKGSGSPNQKAILEKFETLIADHRRR